MMIKKLNLYINVLYRGELLKKIEYKIKDLIGFFYLRNILTPKNKNIKIKNIGIDFKVLNEESGDVTDRYNIFNEVIKYDNIVSKLECDNEFWRKIKIFKHNDIKIIWEYNRLQFLLPILINYIKTKDDKYRKFIIDILDCWQSHNKFEYSLNWYSNLEVAIRAINISILLLFLNDERTNEKYSSLLYLHAKHIYNEINFSDKCIPNNHVIGEATALLMLSKFLDVKENKKWYNCAIKILEKYKMIIDDNGVSKENSFSYQFFVTKMYILCLCFIDDFNFFNIISSKINKSLQVLNYCYIDENTYLNYGDNDDGFLYSTSNKYSLVDDIRQYYNLFTDGKMTTETNLYMDIFTTFNPDKKIIKFQKNNKKYIHTKELFIYKKDMDLIFFNAKNIDAHAHNDSLSVNLIVNNKEIFIDSGTYSYNISKNDRDYYRSREAHSTILFEDKNAIPIATFRWKNYINCYIKDVIENEKYIEVTGVLDNICSRTIKIYKQYDMIEIIDNSNNSNRMISNFILPKDILFEKNKISIKDIKIKFENDINNISDVEISKKYLTKQPAKGCQIIWFGKFKTIIKKNCKEGDLF